MNPSRRGRTPARAGALLSLLALCACSGPSVGSQGEKRASPPPPPIHALRVLAVHPHDPAAYTQGLLWHDGRLWESTGRYGVSSLREVDPESGRVVREVALPDDQFGEGLALEGGRLVQLTWREGIARVWRLQDLAALDPFRFEGEGWGLTSDGGRFVQSDGSAVLVFRALDDFRPVDRIVVRRGGNAVPYLNELEWVDGAIYANVWMSDEILRIDPESGEVTDVWDASGLLTPAQRVSAEVLNGIAWDPMRKRFLITGKLWPSLFEVELPRSLSSPQPGR